MTTTMHFCRLNSIFAASATFENGSNSDCILLDKLTGDKSSSKQVLKAFKALKGPKALQANSELDKQVNIYILEICSNIVLLSTTTMKFNFKLTFRNMSQ